METRFVAGRILDIGGKKVDRRGSWLPAAEKGVEWEYLNIDPGTQPDYCCSADQTGLGDGCFDGFIMCELLEHVEEPSQVLREARRLVRAGAVGLITMPFLNQVHADPDDFQRWTPSKFRSELERAGFVVESVLPMGSLFAVVYDLILSAISRWQVQTAWKLLPRLFRVTLNLFLPLVLSLDRQSAKLSPWITTGWKVIVYAK